MRNFKVVATLDSDTGKHKLNFVVCVEEERLRYTLVRATESAVYMIIKSQNCPESAIIDLKLTPIKD